MIFALTLVQFAGSILLGALGSKRGAILSGFLGGLVSSTATIASLAKRSKGAKRQKDVISETLTFLSATIAMLAEGVVIFVFGTKEVHTSVLVLFCIPALVAFYCIVVRAKAPSARVQSHEQFRFEFSPTLKLSVFIAAILSVSKILQYFFGNSGLVVLTFLVSLFEIHGSFIANVQLHDGGAIDLFMLGICVAVSIAAACLSKWFLIFTLASSELKSEVKKESLYLLASLILGWLVFWRLV